MKVPASHFRRPRIEMIPLIDTFFLLLAFFISSVLTMEVVRGLPVELPRTEKSSSISIQKRLLITVGQDGDLQLEGESVTLESLQNSLKSSSHLSDLQVGVRADRKTPYELVVRVLSVIRESGVSKVALLTQTETPS